MCTRVTQLVKNPPAMQEIWVPYLGWEDSPGDTNSYSLQYSGLEHSMDCIVHGVAKSWTRLSDLLFHFFFFTCTRILSHVWLFATPWTVALQAPLSVEVSRQRYWSGLPFPTPGLDHVSRCCFSITIVEAKQTGVRWTESRKKGYCEHRTKRILSP